MNNPTSRDSDTGGHTYRHPRPAVTVDVVVLALREQSLCVLLIQRKHEPFSGAWALPGGFVEMHENLSTAARRELAEETSLRVNCVEQLHTFGAVDRDPRGRVISVAHMALLNSEHLARTHLLGASDASDTAWRRIDDLPELAFDHAQILAFALERLREQVKSVAYRLLPAEFTITDVQAAYEAVLARTFDSCIFAHELLASGQLEETGKTQAGANGPLQRYRRAHGGTQMELAQNRVP